MSSAIAEVMSVPTTRGAPWKMLRLTSQSLPKMKLSPNVLSAFVDSPMRRTKKYAMSSRIRTARVVRPHCRTWSGSRDAGDR